MAVPEDTGVPRDRRARAPRRFRVPPLSLATRLLIGNAAVLVVAVLVIALTPAKIPAPTSLTAVLVLLGGLAAVILTDLLLLRRTLRPLERLADAMGRVEPLLPGERVPLYGDNREVLGLTMAFNEMLDRLEAERRLSVRRSLMAQEGERKRVARELHDEVGQVLTAILLELNRLSVKAPGELSRQAAEAREAARQSLEEVRRIARRLRPEALDELGLRDALASLCERIADHGSLAVTTEFDGADRSLTEEEQLVVYRVVQEALTNVLRHADASMASVSVEGVRDRVVVTVSDDGRGLGGAKPGAGMQGMRERALLTRGRLLVRERPDGGTEVRLELPLGGGQE